MPKAISDIKEFVKLASASQTKVCRVKRNGSVFKFKLRGPNTLHTLTVNDAKKAAKIKKSLPRAWKIVNVPEKKELKKKK
ncbi:putative large subunit ribosomal protein L38e [Blattamonas nauphoetae]|uniref:Large subunit ribosomal protein L38e n=1 Tax=Blattamonas nauphoetae TaxID=2049346 RepID=A0ABQ9XLZ1_9EUKA|nr:putative large subunit ribosomal protein L38e [Blattamonas nauphoetae]